MKRLLVLLALCLSSLASWAANVGDTFCNNILCYKITSSTTVMVVGVGEFGPHTGDFSIPESVLYQSITYSVTAIGTEAFYGRSGLTSLTIPNSVTYIEPGAFYGCSGLTSVTIPNSVTYIDPGAFYGCSGLTSLTIPNSVTSIGAQAFSGCYGLETIMVDEGNPHYDSRDNCNAIIESSTNTLIAGTKNTVIPNSVTSIGEVAFFGCTGLTGTLIIPSSVTSIGDDAFLSCDKLDNVIIPSSVTTIGGGAFSGVKKVIYCGTATGAPWGALRAGCFYTEGDFVFADSTKTTLIGYIGAGGRVTIPNSVTTIADSAFLGCSSLTAITIPDSVTTVGDYAFSGCTGLKMVSIGESVTRIGENSFEGCINVDTMYYNAINLGSTQSWQDSSRGFCPMQLDTLVIGNKVRTIPEEVFRQQSNLTSVIIPNSVKIIEDCAFDYCGNLSNVTFGDSVTIIERWAFEGCGFTSLILPNLLQSIEDYVFNGCGNLRSVTFGDSLKSIGSGAFFGCGNLRSVTFGDSLKSIGSGAFERCYNLDTLTIPSSVETIDGDAFRGTRTVIYCGNATGSPWGALHAGCFYTEGDFVFADESKTTLVSYIGAGGRVTIPTSVTTISDSAFLGCSTLNSITIPNSVATIGVNAFSGVKAVAYCGNATGSPWGALRAGCFCVDGDFVFTDNTKTTLIGYMGAGGRVSIPNSVTIIEDRTFSECTSLTSITIPNSVTTVGERAFSGCSGLKMVSVGESVTQIGNFSFEGCTHVDTMYYNAKNLENTNHWYIPNHGFRPMQLDTLVIGSKVQSLPNNVFNEQNNLTGVTLPNSVTIIGDNAFSYCSNLSHVFFGDSLTTIGMNSFYSCNITNITFPNSLTNISSRAFMSCGNLDTVTIPSSVTTIGANAFSGANTVRYCGNAVGRPWGAQRVFGALQDSLYFQDCDMTIVSGFVEGLTSANIPDGVTAIASNAFLNCTTLTSVTIPSSLTTIENHAFEGCTNVTTLLYNAKNLTSDNSWYNALESNNSYGFRPMPLRTLTIGDSVQTLPQGVFYGQSGLTSLSIPSSMTTIETSAFSGCTNVTTLYYNATNLTTNNYWHEYNFSGYGFRSLPLQTLVVGNGVETLPNYVFYNQSQLSNVSLPESLTSIGTYAFENCTTLTSITLPQYLSSIGAYAFKSCTGLASIEFPESLTSIGDQAFYNCSTLTSLTIPETLTTIGTSAFAYCSGLTDVSLPESMTTISNGVFSHCTSLASITLPSSVTTIGDGAFGDCNALTGISLPNTLTAIGNNAFMGCTSLTHITLPNTVTSIESNTFDGCTSLNNVTIPTSVTTIGNYAFQNCTSLNNVTIPTSVTSIGAGAFRGCTSLASFVVRKTMTIGSEAFEGCTALKTVYNLTNGAIIIGNTTWGNVAKNALRVLDSIGDNTQRGFTNYGTGSNALHQINQYKYTVVDAETGVATQIPRASIPANFIYLDASNAKSSDNWKANAIFLTDGQDEFKAPVDFTADTASYTREFTDGHRSTLYLPFTAAVPSGLEVYEFSGFDGSTLSFSEHITGVIDAYTPYLVGYDLEKSTTQCVITKTNAVFPATTGATPAYTTTHGDMTFHGTTERTGNLSTNNYGYKDGFFVQSGGAAHVNPFRCYFTYTGGGAGQMPPHTLSVAFGDGPLAIDAVEAPATNGSIRYSNDVYDLMGRLVRKEAHSLDGLPSGIYIWKGQKVLRMK